MSSESEYVEVVTEAAVKEAKKLINLKLQGKLN